MRNLYGKGNSLLANDKVMTTFSKQFSFAKTVTPEVTKCNRLTLQGLDEKEPQR
jgi:hypothetical protein